MVTDKEGPFLFPSGRNLVVNVGQAAAGAAVLSLSALNIAKKANAYEYATDYRYAKLDPREAGQLAYENYGRKWCMAGVVAGLAGALREKAGGAWKDFPTDAYRWMDGGKAGWGALCATMPSAGVIIGLVTKDTDTTEAMVNDLAFYYSYTELPGFVPSKVLYADIRHTTVAGVPICHFSADRWMRAEGVGFMSGARAERCARLSADVAMYAAQMLNAWAEGSYRPRHKLLLYNALASGMASSRNRIKISQGRGAPTV